MLMKLLILASTHFGPTDEPGSWFLMAKCLKNTGGGVTLLKMSLSTGVFQTFC